jgi:membrane associated rhomboid family serine protease
MLPYPELDFRRTPVTLLIAAVVVAIELVCAFDPPRREVYYSIWKLGILSTVWSGELWRPFTTTLLHGQMFGGPLLHAVFNVYWLVTFGRALEPYFGSFRYLLVLIVLAFCATMPSFLASNWDTPTDGQHGTVGLSGVIYGLFGILWMGERYRQDFRSVCGPEVIQFFIACFLFCIALTFLGQPIDNVAHGAGCIVGVLFGQALFQKERKWLWRSASAIVTLLLVSSAFAAPGHPLYRKHREAEAHNRSIRDGLQIQIIQPEQTDRLPAENREEQPANENHADDGGASDTGETTRSAPSGQTR